MRIFEALFNGSWPKLSTHALEKCFLRNPHFVFCSSFQNLRLGGVNLHRESTLLKHRHAFIILLCRQTHRHAFIMRCRLTHIRTFNKTDARLLHGNNPHVIMILFYRHIVIMLSSSCYFHMHIVILSPWDVASGTHAPCNTTRTPFKGSRELKRRCNNIAMRHSNSHENINILLYFSMLMSRGCVITWRW